MTPASTDQPDPARQWRDAVDRVCDLVTGASPEQMERTVPACPDWTARDLLSHMVGVGADVLAGEEADDHNEAWTQAHVDARTDRDVAELVQEWQDLADGLEAWMRENGPRPLADVTIHEQDLRGVLDAPGAGDSPQVATVREWMVDRFAAAVEPLPPIALVGREWSWCSTGEVADAATRVEAGDLDLFRALTSRRTAEELRSWTTAGDVDPYLDAFAGLGPLPERPLPGG